MDIVEFSKRHRNKRIDIRLGYLYNLHRASTEKQVQRCKEDFKRNALQQFIRKVRFCLNQNPPTTIHAILMKQALT